MRKTLFLAAALIAAPALAQDNNVAADTNVVAPDTNAADANAMNGDANAVAPLPPVTTEPVAPEPAPAPEPADDDSIPWGLVGLVGLIGLLGRKRS
jgi:hypothetical protein